MAGGGRSALGQAWGAVTRRPAMSLVIVATLALGLGANIAIFSVVEGVLFAPLPYAAPAQLVTQQNGFFPAGYFQGLRARARAIEWAAYTGAAEVTLRQRGQPVEVEGSFVSANFFTLFGVTPELGRGLGAGANQPGRDGEAVLSDALWRTQFGGRAAVVGTVVSIAGRPREIVGVMPAGFRFPSAAAQVWMPARLDPSQLQDFWTNYSLQLVGRMRPGLTLAAGRAELGGVAPAVTATFPYPVPPTWAKLYPLVTLREALVGDMRSQFLLMWGAVGLVLLIACVNVANLLLSEMAGRRREMAIRLALGAGRGRVLRQLVGEAVLLALLGGAAGLGLAVWGIPVLVHLLPADTPQLGLVGLHWPVLAFALAVALGAGAAAGLLPGWRAGRERIEPALRANSSGSGVGRARLRLAGVLLMAEVAVAVVVVVAGTLLSASLVKLSRHNPGFDAAGVTTMRVLPGDAFCSDAGRCREFYQQLQAQAAALPGVRSAALVNVAPLSGGAPIAPAIFEGHPLLPGQQIPLVWANLITPGYLRTMRIHLLAGRGFTAADGAGAQRVVLISSALAKSVWPGENAVGKQVTTPGVNQLTAWTVAGIVGDVREMQLSGDPGFYRGVVYFPYAQALASPPVQGSLAPMTLLLRAAPPPPAAQLQRLIRGLNPDIPAVGEETMTAMVEASLANPRTTTGLFLLFGALALVLSAIGVYGVMAHNVAQRTREFGIRMALGAQPQAVLAMVVRRGMGLALGGIGAGLVAAWALSRLLRGLLFDLSPTSSPVFAAAAVLVAAIALLACYGPARRATHIDPLVALREE
ncbi:MAG: ADOP family duplicated permease [Terriglobales bacterium]